MFPAYGIPIGKTMDLSRCPQNLLKQARLGNANANLGMAVFQFFIHRIDYSETGY
jgi:hypothetical protein